MDPQAEELNSIIKEHSSVVYSLLSQKGKEIFFPKLGIISQTKDAKGKKYNATIGIALEEDGTPMRLTSISEKITLDPKNVFPYTSSYGKVDLRKKWKEMIKEKNPSLTSEMSTPLVTCGLTHGLQITGFMFLDKADELILFDPYWENYNLMFSNWHEAKLSTVPFFDNGLNISGIKKKLMGGGKKVLLLNFPNNPLGYTPTTVEVKELVASIQEAAESGSHIVVLVDDAYFGLVYEEGVEKESLFVYLSNLHENVLAVKIDGATKEDYVWGFRVAFVTYGIKGGTLELYRALEEKTGGAVRGNISNSSHLSQTLLLRAYESPEYTKEKQKKYDLLKKRYEKVKDILKENTQYADFFTPVPYNSGYFMCVSLKEGLDAEEVRQKLLTDYDTGLIASSGMIRVAYSSSTLENLPILFENIYNACKDISK